MNKLIINNLTKKFNDMTAVDHFTTEIRGGELTAVLGPSGCGKSTLLSCIAGTQTAGEGEIILNGRRLFSAEEGTGIPPEERNIGFVFQNYALWPHMTIEKNIAYPLRMRKERKPVIRRKTDQILNLIHLEGFGKRYPWQLSGGEQQRVALGRALVMNPDLLLLDEPLSNLDARLREDMQREIRRIQREFRLTVIHVTHDQAEALSMSDRIIVMNAGKPVQEGTPENIYRNPGCSFTADFVGTSNIIRGKVEGCRKRPCLVCGGSLRIESPGTTLKPGDRGAVSIRPEDIDLSFPRSDAGDRTGTGRGRIVDRVFKGAHIQYRIKTGNELLKVQAHPVNAFKTGDEVLLTFKRITKVE